MYSPGLIESRGELFNGLVLIYWVREPFVAVTVNEIKQRAVRNEGKLWKERLGEGK